MKPKHSSTASYLHQCIKNLVGWEKDPDRFALPGIDQTLLREVAFYIRKRVNSTIDDSEICSLLGEALQKLQKRLATPGETIDSPPRYFREIVKHLVSDKINRENHGEKFLITSAGIASMSENGVPQSILLKFQGMVSSRAMSYRTFMDKLATAFDGEQLSRKKRNLYRRIALGVFRIKLRRDEYSDQMDFLPDPESMDHETTENDTYHDCLQQLKRNDRDLIKLRFGLDQGLHGFQFSFEELQEVFGFRSVQQVRNRYHYILKTLRDCLTAKGYSMR